MADQDDHKSVLKAAEEHIISLKADNDSLKSDLDNMMEAQALEAEQLVQMSEQLWKLEEALMNATDDKNVALLMLQKFKNDVNRIKDIAEHTLSTVKTSKDSRLKVAVQVYEMKSMVEKLMD